MISFKQYFLEKSVLGLEETIYIEGIGQIRAKLDTGNGAFNVLHGEDITQNGEYVRFTTENGMVLENPCLIILQLMLVQGILKIDQWLF